MVTNIRQLRSSTKEILSAVERGETVWITNRGKTCAKITPANLPPKTKFKDEAFGMWKNRKDMENPSEYIHRIRRQWRRYDI